jgi:hypothetical protein
MDTQILCPTPFYFEVDVRTTQLASLPPIAMTLG